MHFVEVNEAQRKYICFKDWVTPIGFAFWSDGSRFQHLGKMSWDWIESGRGSWEGRMFGFTKFSLQLFRNRFNLTKQMLSDNFPVFNIDLDCDFESSDNVFPSYPSPSMLASVSITQESPGVTLFSALGRRKDNLDRCLSLTADKYTLLGVLDGHCDPKVTDYIATHLLVRLSAHPQLLTKPSEAFIQVFASIQKEVISRFEKGSTALVVLISEGHLHVANLGDCQLFGVLKEEGNIKEFTVAHNLANQQQLMGVINRGGIVLKKGNQYRINGQINLSRCFGDPKFKKDNWMTSTPDIYSFPASLCKRWVLATDGFINASKLNERLQWKDPKQLRNDVCLYMDNATAIFLDL